MDSFYADAHLCEVCGNPTTDNGDWASFLEYPFMCLRLCNGCRPQQDFATVTSAATSHEPPSAPFQLETSQFTKRSRSSLDQISHPLKSKLLSLSHTATDKHLQRVIAYLESPEQYSFIQKSTPALNDSGSIVNCGQTDGKGFDETSMHFNQEQFAAASARPRLRSAEIGSLSSGYPQPVKSGRGSVAINRDSMQSMSSYSSSCFDSSLKSKRSTVSTIGSQSSVFSELPHFNNPISFPIIETAEGANTRGSSIQSFPNTTSSIYPCTYPPCPKVCKRKSDWIRHEEQFHDPQFIYTCLLHTCDSLSSLPCATKSHNSFMSPHHLDGHHTSSICSSNISMNPPRFQSTRPDKLIQHLREWHKLGGFKISDIPSSWGKTCDQRNREWLCGFCGQLLVSWKERGDHIGNHLAEGKTIQEWQVWKAREGLQKGQARKGDIMGGLHGDLKRLSFEEVGGNKDTVAPPKDTPNYTTLVSESWEGEANWG